MSFCRRVMENNLEEGFIAQKDDLKGRLWIESKTIWRIAFPSILSRVTSFGMIVVTQSFIGHISDIELATYALLQSILVRFMYGILVRIFFFFHLVCLSCVSKSNMTESLAFENEYII